MEPPPADPSSAVGDEWHCSGWSKQVRGAALEWATSLYRCTPIQWCFCHPLAPARLLQVQLSCVICLSVIYPSSTLLLTHAKKKKKKVNTHLFLASLPLPCLISRQRECMPVFSVGAGQQMFIYCCFLECASLWFGFSSSVIGLKDRVMAVGAPDNLLTRSTRAERRVFALSSLAAGELLSNIQGLRDTAAVCLLLIACTHACTSPQTWQGGGKAASQLLSYASILFLRGVLNISSFEYVQLHQWDNSEQKPKTGVCGSVANIYWWWNKVHWWRDVQAEMDWKGLNLTTGQSCVWSFLLQNHRFLFMIHGIKSGWFLMSGYFSELLYYRSVGDISASAPRLVSRSPGEIYLAPGLKSDLHLQRGKKLYWHPPLLSIHAFY